MLGLSPKCLLSKRFGAQVWTAASHLPHHVGRSLPSSGADVLVEGDVEVCGRLVVLDHVKQGRRSLQASGGRGRGSEREERGNKLSVISN